LNIEGLAFDPQTAVLCGLILNELVTNSVRHAFPGDRKGKIDVRAHTRGNATVVISVSDNGIGMPHDFDIRQVNTLGLKLVRQLSRQLKGSMSVSNQKGTTVQVEFPFREAPPPIVQESV
jgi:two-component sensor histidine kinase